MKHFTYFKTLSLLILFSAISFTTFGQKFTGLTATASSGTATAAVDNNMGTRWESDFSDPQWIMVDLGENKTVGVVKLYWEGANAKDYSISFSTNGTDFTGEIFYTGKAGGSRTDVIDNLNVNCRFIKVNGTARNLVYGYSIWEFEVYPPVIPVLTSLSLTPATSTIKLGETKQLTVGGLDQIGNPFTLTNATTWGVNGTGANVDANGLFSSTAKGLFTVTATNSSLSKTATVDVLPLNDNIAIGATATASSGTASAAIDNNGGTRWESLFTDPQWIMVDFGAKKNISDIIITWEGANAKDYVIETSNNGTDWTTLVTKTAMAAGARTDRMYDLSVDAQYVKLTGTARNLNYGYSIWEFKIFGTVATTTVYPPIMDNNRISVYPNPAGLLLNFSTEVAKAALYSLQGQLVVEKNNISILDVAFLKRGMYILKLTNADGYQQSTKIELR